jgi:hypothetical protein
MFRYHTLTVSGHLILDSITEPVPKRGLVIHGGKLVNNSTQLNNVIRIAFVDEERSSITICAHKVMRTPSDTFETVILQCTCLVNNIDIVNKVYKCDIQLRSTYGCADDRDDELKALREENELLKIDLAKLYSIIVHKENENCKLDDDVKLLSGMKRRLD